MTNLKAIKRVIEMYQTLVQDIAEAKDESSKLINRYKLHIDKLMQEVDFPMVIVPSELVEYPKFLKLVSQQMDKEMPNVTISITKLGVPAGEMAMILHKHQMGKGTTERTYLEEVSLSKAAELVRSSTTDDVLTKLDKIFSYCEGKMDDDEVFIYMQDLDNLRVAVIKWLGIFNFLNTDLWWVQDND